MFKVYKKIVDGGFITFSEGDRIDPSRYELTDKETEADFEVYSDGSATISELTVNFSDLEIIYGLAHEVLNG